MIPFNIFYKTLIKNINFGNKEIEKLIFTILTTVIKSNFSDNYMILKKLLKCFLIYIFLIL